MQRTKGKKRGEVMGDDDNAQSNINNQEEYATRQQPDRSKEKERIAMATTMNMIDDHIPRRKFASAKIPCCTSSLLHVPSKVTTSEGHNRGKAYCATSRDL